MRVIDKLLFRLLAKSKLFAIFILDTIPTFKDPINKGIVTLVNKIIERRTTHLLKDRIKRLFVELAFIRYFYRDRPFVRCDLLEDKCHENQVNTRDISLLPAVVGSAK